MKIPPNFRLLLLFACASTLFVACSKETVEPDSTEPSADAAAADLGPPEPDNGDEASAVEIEAELDAMVSALEEGDGLLGETFANLSEEHRQTLQAAMEKAVQDLDLGLLGSAIGANLGSLDNASVKVLSAEEAKQLGIDLEAIQNSGPGVSVQSRVISIGIAGTDSSDSAESADSPADDGEPLEDQGMPAEIILETQQVDDHAATQRIQELLEAGDSDALAGELTKLLQNGVDAASLNQLIGE